MTTSEIIAAIRAEETGLYFVKWPLNQFLQICDELERLEHELMVTKASERYNAEYARAFELERDALRKENEELKR